MEYTLPNLGLREITTYLGLLSFQLLKVNKKDLEWQGEHLKCTFSQLTSLGSIDTGEIKIYNVDLCNKIRMKLNISDNELLCELNSGPLVCNERQTAWYSHRRRIMFEYINENAVARLQINFKKYAEYMCTRGDSTHLNKIINFIRVTRSNTAVYFVVYITPYPIIGCELIYSINLNCIPSQFIDSIQTQKMIEKREKEQNVENHHHTNKSGLSKMMSNILNLNLDDKQIFSDINNDSNKNLKKDLEISNPIYYGETVNDTYYNENYVDNIVLHNFEQNVNDEDECCRRIPSEVWLGMNKNKNKNETVIKEKVINHTIRNSHSNNHNNIEIKNPVGMNSKYDTNKIVDPDVDVGFVSGMNNNIPTTNNNSNNDKEIIDTNVTMDNKTIAVDDVPTTVVTEQYSTNLLNTLSKPSIIAPMDIEMEYGPNENYYYIDIEGVNRLAQLAKQDSEPNQLVMDDAFIVLEAISKETPSELQKNGRYIPSIDFDPINIHVDAMNNPDTDDDAGCAGEYSVQLEENERIRLLNELSDDVAFIQSIMGYRYSLQCIAVKRLTEGLHTSPGGVFGTPLNEEKYPSSQRNTLISRHDKYYYEQFQPYPNEFHTPIVKNINNTTKTTNNTTNSNKTKSDSIGNDQEEMEAKSTEVFGLETSIETSDPYMLFTKLYPSCLPIPYTDTRKSKREVEYYFVLVNIFETYEIEDRLKKYGDIMVHMATNMGKVPQQTLMRPDTYSNKLMKHIENDLFVIPQLKKEKDLLKNSNNTNTEYSDNVLNINSKSNIKKNKKDIINERDSSMNINTSNNNKNNSRPPLKPSNSAFSIFTAAFNFNKMDQTEKKTNINSTLNPTDLETALKNFEEDVEDDDLEDDNVEDEDDSDYLHYRRGNV